MLDTLRNSAKSWVAKILIGLLAVSFAVWGIADVFRGFDAGFLAKVGKVEITSQEFSRAYDQYLQNFSRQTGQAMTQEEARGLGIDRAILNSLIQGAALDHQAQEMKLAVPDSMIATEAALDPLFQNASGAFDPARFRNVLANNGLTEQMYLVSEQRDKLRDAISGTVDGNLSAPKALVEAMYRYRSEQRDARYFVVSTAESEIAAPTDEEIRKEYEANPAAYTAPEYRSIAVLKAEPADVAAKVQLADDDVAAGYERLKLDYFAPERRTILQLSFSTLGDAQTAKSRLASGEDFLTVAKDLGFVEGDITFADKAKTDFLDPAIAEAAFALAEGSVSEPVKGNLNTVLLKATKISPEKQSTLDEVRAVLTERLKLEKAGEEIQSIYDAVEDASAGGAKLDEIATQVSIPLQVIQKVDANGLGMDGKPVEVPHSAELLKAAFASDVGLENAPISLDHGYIWYDVREVVPSVVKPFETVKEQARAAVVAKKISAASAEKAKKLVERARAGSSLDELAKDSAAEIKTAQGLKRNESGADFPAPAVAAVYAVPENGFASALGPDGQSAWVIQSQAVMLPPFDPAAAEAKAIADELKSMTSSDLMQSYLAAVQKDAGASINETLWRQISGTQTQ
jgi:peptidyl-prolyl cis-trans isomerase D